MAAVAVAGLVGCDRSARDEPLTIQVVHIGHVDPGATQIKRATDRGETATATISADIGTREHMGSTKTFFISGHVVPRRDGIKLYVNVTCFDATTGKPGGFQRNYKNGVREGRGLSIALDFEVRGASRCLIDADVSPGWFRVAPRSVSYVARASLSCVPRGCEIDG